jgi:hypothetical protein
MLSFLKRLFTIKLTNGLLPFQEQQFQYNQSPSPLCPSACGCREDLHHFFDAPIVRANNAGKHSHKHSPAPLKLGK